MFKPHVPRVILPALVAGFSMALLGAQVKAEDSCTEGGVVCVTKMKGAGFLPNKKASKKDRKKRGKGASGVLNVTVNNGRGSVFVNGRFAGTAPVQYLEIEAGKNEIQIRDGMIVLADGLLTVPRGQTLAMTILHP